MKWFHLGIVLVVGLGVYKFGVYDAQNPQPTSPQGVAGYFIKMAVAGDDAQLGALCNGAAFPKLQGVARQVAQVVPPDFVPLWQSTKPTCGSHAFTAQVTGKGKMLVIEVRQEDGRSLICEAALADI